MIICLAVVTTPQILIAHLTLTLSPSCLHWSESSAIVALN